MEDDVPRLHPVDPTAANPPNQRADIAFISTSLPNPGAVTLIDVPLLPTIDSMVDLSFRWGMYDRTFDFSSDVVRLEVFAVETSGREGRQFLRVHVTATFSKLYLLLFKLHVRSVSLLREIASYWILPPYFSSLMVPFLYHPQSVSTYHLYVYVMML